MDLYTKNNRVALRGICGLLLASTLLLLATGCGPRRNLALEDARRAYMSASTDPTVVAYAAEPLNDAAVTLDRAEVEYRQGDQSEVNHLAYVTQQEVAKARQIAAEKSARVEATTLSNARDAVVVAGRQQQADAILAQLAALHARETAQGLALTVSDVFFEFDKADLKPSARQDLANVATFIKDNPDRNVVIEGHTDSVGTDSYNDELSKRRAMAVKAFLVSQGVDQSRLTSRGFGEGFPIASNDSDSGRQQNRRVEMLVLNPGSVVSLTSTPVIVHQ